MHLRLNEIEIKSEIRVGLRLFEVTVSVRDNATFFIMENWAIWSLYIRL